jgi:hypothetical protein
VGAGFSPRVPTKAGTHMYFISAIFEAGRGTLPRQWCLNQIEAEQSLKARPEHQNGPYGYKGGPGNI